MRSCALALVLLAVLGASANADAQTDEPQVKVVLENVGTTGKFTVNGTASFLPDGTMLHVSVQIRDHHPPIEAGLFRVSVVGGKYSGTQEWANRTFAPLAYKTVVDLHMEVQTPVVKRFLSKQLGYGAEQVETISVAETLLGTEEERTAFQLQTLRTLNDFLQRDKALHARLDEMVRNKPQNDPAWADFEPGYIEDLKRLREDLLGLQDTRVVWFDIGMFRAIEQTTRQLARALMMRQEGDPGVQSELNNTANELRLVQDQMTSRLPAEPPPEEGR
jgi:hypothetical protein